MKDSTGCLVSWSGHRASHRTLIASFIYSLLRRPHGKTNGDSSGTIMVVTTQDGCSQARLSSHTFSGVFILVLCTPNMSHPEAMCTLEPFLFFFFFWWDWDLNSRLHFCKAGTLLLGPHLQSILLWLLWRWGSQELFAWAGLEP
jgi:hypothetical protein